MTKKSPAKKKSTSTTRRTTNRRRAATTGRSQTAEGWRRNVMNLYGKEIPS